jgi:hypothetical protein
LLLLSIPLLMVAMGCNTSVEYIVKPLSQQGYVTSETARQQLLSSPAVELQKIVIHRKKSIIQVDRSDIDNCLMALEKGGLFSRVYYDYNLDPNNAMASITCEFNQEEDLHSVGNGTRAFFIGFTLYLLSPVLGMDYSFESDMTATIHFVNGEEVVCQKRAKGKCTYSYFYPAANAGQGIRAKVLEENCKAITADFIRTLPLKGKK